MQARSLTKLGVATGSATLALALAATATPTAPVAHAAQATAPSTTAAAAAKSAKAVEPAGPTSTAGTVEAGGAAVAGVITSGPSQVQVRKRIAVRGQAPVLRKARTVRLLEKKGARWKVIAKKRTAKSGAYSFAPKAGNRVGTRVMRVHAPRAKGLKAMAGHPFAVRVVGSVATTSSGDWNWGGGAGARARWNSCAPITWSYQPAGGAYNALGDVQTAMSRISARTGLRFQYTGATGGALTLGWSTAAGDRQLAGGTAGYGRYTATTARSGGVHYRIFKGSVVLDRQESLRAGFATSGNPTWGQVITHEVLHTLGLGHAGGRSQLMYPVAHASNHNFGSGDVAGMRAVGTAGGCVG